MKLSLFRKIFTIVCAAAMMLALYLENSSVATQETVSNETVITDSIVSPKSTVGIVRSGQTLATAITYDELRNMIQEAVKLAGGFDETLIQDGDVVVLKPNLVSSVDYSMTSRLLPAEANGITTDWRIVKIVSEMVRTLNPHGKIYIMEGSGAGMTYSNMQNLKYKKANFPAVDSIIYLEQTAKWDEYSSPNLVSCVLPEGKGIYPDNLKPNKSKEIYLNKTYKQADVLISLPVLKNHEYTGITGAIKNVGIGGTPANIYGSSASNPSRQDLNRIDHLDINYRDNLHRWIHDFYLCRPVDYVIVDGLQGSTNGPVAGLGTPDLATAQRNMRLILAGRDPLAVDAIHAFIIGNDPAQVKHLNYLSRDSVGVIDPAFIRVNGKLVHEIKKKFDFRMLCTGSFSQYNDLKAPDCTIDSFEIRDGGKLWLSVSSKKKLSKVEVEYNGQRLEKAAISKFNNLLFDLGRTDIDPSLIKIFVMDRYLNCTVKALQTSAVNDGKTGNPQSFILHQNYPNPFNPATSIQYSIPKGTEVKLNVFDISGRRVASLVNGFQPAGEHKVSFNASNLSSGVYVYRLEASGHTLSKKLTLLK